MRLSIPSLLVSSIFLTACGGGEKTTPPPPTTTPSINITPIANAGIDITINEQETVSLHGNGSDSDGSISSYSWVQSDGYSVILSGENSSTASFVSPDIVNEEILTFILTVTDNDGSTATDTIKVTVKPYDITFNLPDNIGNGCEFNTQISNTSAKDIASINWHVLSNTNELIVQGDVIDNNSITTTIPNAGEYSLSATVRFTNGLTAERSDMFVVKKALPKDIKSVDYVISSDQTQLVCHDVNIWNDATLELKEGANLSSIDGSSKKIFMWGDVDLLGTETNRVSISNVVFENDFFITNSTITVNASYVDFINDATISNDSGTTNISYSTFDSQFNQRDKGTVIYNAFNKGFSTKPDGAIIKHNDIYCDGLSSCMSVSNYMFGSALLNAKPTIEYNNIFDAANNSITYNNDSFTESDIDLRNNYWGGKTLIELSDVFVDANDTPDKAHIFLFDPMINDVVDHSNVTPVASAGVEQTVNANDTVLLDGSDSNDVDGNTLSYKWSIVSKPSGSHSTIDTTNTVQTRFIPDIVGVYKVQLIVNDGYINSLADTVVITVIEQSGVPTITLTKKDILGNYSDVTFPYSSNEVSSVNVSGVPAPRTYTIARFGLNVIKNLATIINLKAVDSSGNVTPYFSGISEGATLRDGATIYFDLISPLTNSKTSALSYSFEIKETGEIFEVDVSFKSN